MLKDNGLRLLLVGYESGNQQILHNIKKGMRIDVAKQLHQGLPRTGHHHPRHLHPGPARRDQGDDRGDDQIRRPRSTRTPSRSRWPRPIPARSSTSRRWRTAGSTPSTPSWSTITASRSRRCTIRISRHQEIFNSVETFYKTLLFPRRQDRLDRERDGAQPGDDEAPPARGRGVLPVPARTGTGVLTGSCFCLLARPWPVNPA